MLLGAYIFFVLIGCLFAYAATFMRGRSYIFANEAPPYRATAADSLGIFAMLLMGVCLLPYIYGYGVDALQLSGAREAIISALCFQLGLLFIIFISRFIFPVEGMLNASGVRLPVWVLTGIQFCFMSFPIVFGAQLLWLLFLGFLEPWIGPVEPQDMVAFLSQIDGVGYKITAAATAAILAPIVEELIFRGFIYRVCKTICGPLGAGVISSLLFACVHYHIGSFLPLFILGMLLVRAYESRGHIGICICFHACFNINTLVFIFLQ